MNPKVLHINTFDHYGGAEKIAYNLYKAIPESSLLVKQKLQYKGDNHIQEFQPNVLDRLIILLDKVIWKLGWKKGGKVYLQASEQLNTTFGKLKKLTVYREADIIHLHNIHGGYFDLEAIAKIAGEKKVVWTIHDMWPITGGEAYLFDNIIPLRHNINKVLEFYPLNGPLLDRRAHFLKKKKMLYRQHAHNIFFVPVSKWLHSRFIQAPVFDENLKLKVIYNGIDAAKYVNLNQRTWKTPRVLFFNSESPFKGASVFIASLKQINTAFELVVVGKNIDALPANVEVRYLAKLTDEGAMAHLFNSVDILVFPSLVEAFGLLPAEAMLCGVAVIASDAGGLPELVKDGETGFLFKNGESNDLALKLQAVIYDLDKAREIGANSSGFVAANFSHEKMVTSYQHLYRTVLQTKGTKQSIEIS